MFADRHEASRADIYLEPRTSTFANKTERLTKPPKPISWEALTTFPWKNKHYRKLRREARLALSQANAQTEYQKLAVLTSFVHNNMKFVATKKDDEGPGSLMRAAESREGVCFHFSGLLCMLLRDEHIKSALMYGMLAPETVDIYEHCAKPQAERQGIEFLHAWAKVQASGTMVLADPTDGTLCNYTNAPENGYTAERMYFDAEKDAKIGMMTDLAPLLRRQSPS